METPMKTATTEKSFPELARLTASAGAEQAIISRALELASLYYRDQLVTDLPRTYGAAWRCALRLQWIYGAGYPSALDEVSGTLQRIGNARGAFEMLDDFKASWES